MRLIQVYVISFVAAFCSSVPIWSASQFEQLCNSQNDGASCNSAGWEIRINRPKLALNFFLRGCDLGEKKSCNNAALLQLNNHDFNSARKLFSRACEIGHGGACYWLVDAVSHGREAYARRACRLGFDKACGLELIHKNEASLASSGDANTLYSQCEAGIKSSCFSLAAMMRDRNDLKSALPYFRKACSDRIPMSCYWAGKLAFNQSKKEAKHFFERACNFKIGIACFELANAVAQRGSAPEAMALLSKGCRFDSADACFKFANLNVSEKDKNKYMQKSCELGHSGGCEQVIALPSPSIAAMITNQCNNGKLLPAECLSLALQAKKFGRSQTASQWMTLACNKGETLACVNKSGTIDEKLACDHGDAKSCRRRADIEPNTASKKSLLLKACNLHDAESCTALAILQQIDANPISAQATYEQACKLQDGKACYRLGEILRKAGRQKDAEMMFTRACAFNFGWDCPSFHAGQLEVAH